MIRKLLMVIAITAGTAATCASIFLGWSSLGPGLVHGMRVSETRRVTLQPSGLQYFEDENVLTLAAEAAPDREIYSFIVYIPGGVRWSKEVPHWCRHRRAEVVAEIKRLSAGEPIMWVEYEFERGAGDHLTRAIENGGPSR